MKNHLRITLKSRLETAAAAIVQRMMSLNKPLVFLPRSPFKKGSTPVVVDMTMRCLRQECRSCQAASKKNIWHLDAKDFDHMID